MFYEFCECLKEIKPEDVKSDNLTVAYVSNEELTDIYKKFGFSQTTVNACKKTNTHFRSGVENYTDYTFTELRVIGESPEEDDCLPQLYWRSLSWGISVSGSAESY